jgi:YbgC/YbaW family acyl-CoA thioester hydrolase
VIKFEPVSVTIAVRPNDLDSLGHVNNATVLEYLEAGRWAWLQHYKFQGKQKIIPVVARIEVNYHKEIMMENVVVKTDLAQNETSSYYRAFFHQSVEVIKEGKSITAIEAYIKVGFIDSVERKLRTVQDFLEDNQ